MTKQRRAADIERHDSTDVVMGALQETGGDHNSVAYVTINKVYIRRE